MNNPVAPLERKIVGFIKGKHLSPLPKSSLSSSGSADRVDKNNPPKLGILPRAVLATGKGLAKLGGGWGAAVGGGVGLAIDAAISLLTHKPYIACAPLFATWHGLTAMEAKDDLANLKSGTSQDPEDDAGRVTSVGALAIGLPAAFAEALIPVAATGGSLVGLAIAVPAIALTAVALIMANGKAKQELLRETAAKS